LNELVVTQGVPKETLPDPRLVPLSYCRCAKYTHLLYFLDVPTITLSLTVRDRGVQKNRLTEKTERTDKKLTEKTEPRKKTD
jgi:hypothetical protein